MKSFFSGLYILLIEIKYEEKNFSIVLTYRVWPLEVTRHVDRLAVPPDNQAHVVVVRGLHGAPLHGLVGILLLGHRHTDNPVLPDCPCKR